MNSDEKDKFEHEKSNEDPLNFNSSSMSSDWQFCGANLSSGPVNLVRPGSSLAFCREDLIGSSPCSSASMVDSLGTALWDHPTSVENFGYCDVNTANNLSTSNQLGIRRAPHASLRSDIGWNPPSSMIKGSLFPPSALGTLPESLTHFPADSGFIERAARFSCFNGGNLSNMMNPFGIPENGGLYPITGGLVPGPLEIFPGGCPKPISGARSDKNEMNIEASRDVHLLPTQGTSQGSPLKNEGKSESFARSRDEARQSVGGSGNESDEAEFSGGGSGRDNPSMLEDNGGEGSAKGLDRKKRKRSGEDAELDKAKGAPQLAETVKDGETHQKLEHNPNSNTSKPTGKNNKQGTQGSDPPKEEYIHVRARRGQATNSHSLAERVRREKISERMKFLQDLVPGCSKVTGKAVMLDEIINYVQSLQRQVEFLSMKLAAVNPRLDFNLEGILAKDILQSRAGPSSALGFSHDMPMAYPPMHPQPTPAGVVQLALTGIGSPSDAVRRAMHNEMTHVSGGFRDPSQVHHPWEDELNNVVQMGFASVTNSSSQEADGSLPPSHVKVEL